MHKNIKHTCTVFSYTQLSLMSDTKTHLILPIYTCEYGHTDSFADTGIYSLVSAPNNLEYLLYRDVRLCIYCVCVCVHMQVSLLIEVVAYERSWVQKLWNAQGCNGKNNQLFAQKQDKPDCLSHVNSYDNVF